MCSWEWLQREQHDTMVKILSTRLLQIKAGRHHRFPPSSHPLPTIVLFSYHTHVHIDILQQSASWGFARAMGSPMSAKQSVAHRSSLDPPHPVRGRARPLGRPLRG